jgi:hypothetical protein
MTDGTWQAGRSWQAGFGRQVLAGRFWQAGFGRQELAGTIGRQELAGGKRQTVTVNSKNIYFQF